MIQQCRHILLVEYSHDDDLIGAIGTIEKQLPPYDYASRPFSATESGGTGHFKFLAFKELKPVTAFPKFFDKVVNLQKKLNTVRISAGYVTLTNVVAAALQPSQGAIQVADEFYLKTQLVFSEKTLAAYAFTDAYYRDRRSVIYLNDVWQLVKGARK